jgi:hypothetical protein
MSRYAWIAAVMLLAAFPAAAQTAVGDLRGTWKGESESLVLGGGNSHHPAAKAEPQLRSVPFTLVIDKQDGRRISGTFSSPRSSEKVVAVVSRDGRIMMADDDGFTVGSILAPNRIELCYVKPGATRIASCTELTKQ